MPAPGALLPYRSERERKLRPRLVTFVGPPTTARYLRAADGRSRRFADIAGRQHERRNGARKRIYRVTSEGADSARDRDRGAPRGAAPPTPPGIRVRTAAVRSS